MSPDRFFVWVAGGVIGVVLLVCPAIVTRPVLRMTWIRSDRIQTFGMLRNTRNQALREIRPHLKTSRVVEAGGLEDTRKCILRKSHIGLMTPVIPSICFRTSLSRWSCEGATTTSI